MQHHNILKFGLFIPAFFSLAGCTHDQDTKEDRKNNEPIVVVIDKPSRASMGGINASGQIEALNSISISTRLMGRITKIYVKVGDNVKQGQLLAAISSEDLTAKKAQADAQIAGAQAELATARKDFDRYNTLFSRQSATASELDNATLRLKGATARLEASQQMRREIDASDSYAHLSAPFTGVVTQKLMDEGSLATPGTPILALGQNGILRVSTTVAENDIPRIRKGDKAVISIRSTGTIATGFISEIGISSAAAGQYPVKINLPPDIQKNVYAGMYVNVFIPLKEQGAADSQNKTVLIPRSALLHKDQLTGIYTIGNNHTALLRWIRTGKEIGDSIEVLSGLGPGESFILKASDRLYDGAPIQEK